MLRAILGVGVLCLSAGSLPKQIRDFILYIITVFLLPRSRSDFKKRGKYLSLFCRPKARLCGFLYVFISTQIISLKKLFELLGLKPSLLLIFACSVHYSVLDSSLL